jgi:hypothetical protein
MHNRSLTSIVTIFLFATAVYAQQPKPRPIGGTVAPTGGAPWSISDDERLSLRQAAAPSRRSASSSASIHGFSEHIEGRQHPELLFPVELFDNLLRGVRADTRLRNNARRLYDQKIRAIGYEPDSFWAKLQTSATDYIAAADAPGRHRGATDFVTRSGRKLWVPISRDLCSARFSSLQEARRLFGRTAFDRFLYSAVAPEVSYSATGSMTGEDHAEQLRYMAGGCQ